MNNFTRKFGFSLSALLPVLLLSTQSPLVLAEETETQKSKTQKSKNKSTKKSCTQCLKYMGWRGILDVGVSYVSDDSLKFGDYRGLEEEGFYAAVDGDVHFRNQEGKYFDLYARNLGYDSRQLDLRTGTQGSYELRFAWQEIPKYRGYGAETPYLGVGSDFLTLPEDWVRANTTSGMTALQSSLAAATLKTRRKTLDAGLTLNISRNWTYRVDYQRQEKKGTRTLGAGMFYSYAMILPAPVDFTTNQYDMALSWGNKRGQVQFGFIGSYFDNGNSSLTWDNAFRSQPELQQFRAALEPSNEYYQFSFSGAYTITPRIRLSGKLATGRLSQDDTFLPYSINPKYSNLPLPRAYLGGRLDTGTSNVAGKLSARLNRRLSLTVRGKWDERINKTPVDLYTPVITDLIPLDERYNRPFSYERQLYSADLRFKAHRILRLSGGARWENIDRTLQAVERTKETTWWGEASLTPWVSSQLRIKLESADREMSDYQQPDDGGPVDHPLMRKFHLADRDRDRVLVELDLIPGGNFGINLHYIRAEADYDKSAIGLQESDDESYTINFSYAMGKKINLYAYYTRDNIDADILNSTGVNATPWRAQTNDKITTAGFGLTAHISEKSSIGLDLVSSDSKGNISVQTEAGEDPFAPLKTDLRNARLHFDYEINDHWGYKLYAEYEKFDSQDWAIDGLGVDGLNSVLSMGVQSPKYDVWYLRAQASYRF